MSDLAKITMAISANIPGWTSRSTSDYLARPVTGGLTNVLTAIEPLKPSAHPVIALIREYGSATSSFMKRAQEDKVVHVLSRSGLAPTLYASYEWGRVERYVPDARVLTTKEFGSATFAPRVAELLGRFHALSPQLMPLCDSPGTHSLLGERLQAWTRVALKTRFPGDELKTRRLHALGMDLIHKEVDWLLNVAIAKISSPVVFCHCDVQENNILLGTVDDTLHLIDFEYSDRIERGFDLANAFCEMSMTYDVHSPPGFCLNPDDMPSAAVRDLFFRAYCVGAKIEPTQTVLRSLELETRVFCLASHLHWAIWSVCMASQQHKTFDYLEYSAQRLCQYHALKAELEN